jgi:hypothetical protein
MPLLQVRDVPEHVYRRLAEQAERERRSLAQQALTVLVRGLDMDLDAKARRREVLRAIREADGGKARRLSDPARLIREDRRR